MAQPLTNDLRERTKRIASQFKTADLLRVAAYLVEQADDELDGAHPDMDFTVDLGDILSRLETIAGQADAAFVPDDARDWDMSLGAAQLGLAA